MDGAIEGYNDAFELQNWCTLAWAGDKCDSRAWEMGKLDGVFVLFGVDIQQIIHSYSRTVD